MMISIGPALQVHVEWFQNKAQATEMAEHSCVDPLFVNAVSYE